MSFINAINQSYGFGVGYSQSYANSAGNFSSYYSNFNFNNVISNYMFASSMFSSNLLYNNANVAKSSASTLKFQQNRDPFLALQKLLNKYINMLGNPTKPVTEEVIIEEQLPPDFAAVNENAVRPGGGVFRQGGVTVDGSGQTLLVKDDAGRDNNYVSGVGNRVEFIGDSQANTFNVGGEENVVSIYNLGKDDVVKLSGPASLWETVDTPQSVASRGSSHHLVYHNLDSNTYVKIASDESKRDAGWLQNRVVFNS